MSSFVVDYLEACELQNDWLLFKKEVDSALDNMDARIKQLEALGSFQGAAAESIKLYFAEVHGGFLKQMRVLADVLSRDYATAYLQEFGRGAVSESMLSARWSSSSMSETEKRSWKEFNGGGSTLDQLDKLLRTAASEASSGGCSYNFPNTQGIREAIRAQAMQTQKVRDGVAGIEAKGTQAFQSKSGDFASTSAAIKQAIKSWKKGKVSITGYSAGMFAAVHDVEIANNACAKVEASLEAQAQEVAEIQSSTLISTLNLYEHRIDEGIEKKIRQTELLLTVVVAELGLAIVGLVEIASAGTATPIVPLLMSIIDVGTTTGRVVDTSALLQELRQGNLDDVQVTDVNGKKVIKVGGKVITASEEIIKEYEQYKEKGLDQVYKDIGGFIQKHTNDEVFRELVDQGIVSQEELDLIRDSYSETKNLINGASTGTITGVSVGKGSAQIVDDFIKWRIAETDNEITANQTKINKYDNLAKDYGIDPSDFKYSLEGKTCEVDLTESAPAPSTAQDPYTPGAGKYKTPAQGSKSKYGASDEWHH